jgi:diguanylate cyclase (GGDEF)-like protein
METGILNQIDTRLLEDAPLGLLLQVGDGRIEWTNALAAELLGAGPAELAGRRPAELGETVQRILQDQPSLYHDPLSGRWLRRSIRHSGAGERLWLLSDVSGQEALAEENARLRQQVEDLKLTDDLTGLPNRRAINQALDLHVSRSRRYLNPLSVMLVHVELAMQDAVQPLSADPVLLAVSRFLRDRLRWVDQIARWEDNLFLLVLPETGEQEARGLLDKLASEQDSVVLPPEYQDLQPRLGFGLGCWKKGDDARTLLRQAVQDLRAASGA